MRILFVTSSLSPGGAERVLTLLANRWCESHEVTVVTLKGTGSDFFSLDSRVRRHALGIVRTRWWMPLPYLRIVACLRRIFRTEKPDYVVSLVIKTNIFTLMAGRGLGMKVVVCEHSIIDRDDIDGRQGVLRAILYPAAEQVAVLSESIREEFLRKYPRFDPRRLVVIPNPVQLHIEQEPECLPIAELFGTTKEEIDTVLAMGRLTPSKGYDTLLAAFSVVHRRNLRARLVLFGDGPERGRLEHAVRDMGLSDVVRLPGQTRSPGSVLAQADVFAMTSRFEGFPMALVEAFCAGLPTAAFDAPGVRDLVVDNKNGILVPRGGRGALAAAILLLLGDADLRRRLGAGARSTADRFNPAAIDRIWFEKVLVQ